ncbi:hypothetical protein FHX49_000010 [Microbacterium endophyticum]|uniref:Uncharacterized protein n=1 Tax=Microbacterium endophyticum TaxID=1526412 RepID=A0A7W4YLH9_9MICO|nr:hypothetical protein [Microbacterium endophyticum]MBB2974469.1 hypothetical protein [Microbacterium endophyticum]NIK36766.1 hypothetical protein [Microbacterium endophyticum]
MRFPPLRLVYAREKRDAATGETLHSGSSYYADVWKYLQNWGYRILNDLYLAGFAPAAHADLAWLFETRVLERATTFHPYDGKGPGLSTLLVEEMANKAATAVLRDWTPTWIARQQALGSIGGKLARRRSKTWTESDVDKLAKLGSLQTMQQKADALGRSLRTTQRMAAALAAREGE